MIYRYIIFTSDGLWEGWAHNTDEMRSNFDAAYPDAKSVLVFLYGDKPDGKLTDYQQEMLNDYIAEQRTV